MNTLAIALLRGYRAIVSPALPPSCIFSPSCSAYALEAFRRHGFARAASLTVRRLCRCWPWCAGGHDPVP